MIITIPTSDLFANLRCNLNFALFEVEDFCSNFDVIEATSGDKLALNSERIQSTPFCNNGTLSQQKQLLGWFGFWMCVFNNSDPRSDLEHQALGAIRGLFFAAAAFDLLIPTYLQAWWSETVEIHGCQKPEQSRAVKYV